MRSPTPLGKDSYIAFSRQFHVELLRGGMNRLLLRALPTADQPSRIEVFFQYVQHMDIPMRFDSLAIRDVTPDDFAKAKYRELLQRFSDCRVFRLESAGTTAGHVLAGACFFGEDAAPLGAESMFPMMG
jgi:hypothetical protein